jgi:hypothetical protein
MQNPFPPLLVLLTAGCIACEYVEAEPGGSTGTAGATGQGDSATSANGGAPGPDFSGESAVSASQQACRRVCAIAAGSLCPNATTDIEFCTTRCEAILVDACGRPFTEYVLCAETGEDVLCLDGPVVHGCEDLFREYLDCAGQPG